VAEGLVLSEFTEELSHIRAWGDLLPSCDFSTRQASAIEGGATRSLVLPLPKCSWELRLHFGKPEKQRLALLEASRSSSTLMSFRDFVPRRSR
jgi:hypothetical protein